MSDATVNRPIDQPPIAPEERGQVVLPRDAGMLRHLVRRELEPALTAHHREERAAMLRQAGAQLAWQDPRDILRQLASDYGMSWAAIAKMVGVTPTAIRKWRRGEAVSPDARESLAGLLAFLQYASSCQPISDIGSWLEMRVVPDAQLTPIDLYSAGASALLLDWLGEYMSVDEMLDQFEPDWQTKYARDTRFEVSEGPDGDRAIVQRK
jgi:transcriptional regulator with XRE-family HTH domain